MRPVKEQVNADIEHLKELLGEESNRIPDNSAELETHMAYEGFKDGFRLGV